MNAAQNDKKMSRAKAQRREESKIPYGHGMPYPY